MGKFVITQDMVNKIKRIKDKGDFITAFNFFEPTFKNINEVKKISKALIGSNNIISIDDFRQGDAFAFTTVNPGDINQTNIKLTKDLIMIFGPSFDRSPKSELDFPGSNQIIRVPTAGTVINLSNPGNKNEIKTNLVFANPAFNKRSAEIFARRMNFPVGKITQLPNSIDIKTSQKFNPRNFKFSRSKRINNKIVEKILTNRLI